MHDALQVWEAGPAAAQTPTTQEPVGDGVVQVWPIPFASILHSGHPEVEVEGSTITISNSLGL